MRFGPAGMPLGCPHCDVFESLHYCKDKGLMAMEIEFVRGVYMKEEIAKEVGALATQLNITLSVHAPYFINLASKDENKRKASQQRIINTARVAQHLGKDVVIVIHPGYYQGQDKNVAYAKVKRSLEEVIEVLQGENIKVQLGVETMGKKSAFGSLEENISLAQELDDVTVVIDFAHLHARGEFNLTKRSEFERLFDKVEEGLGNAFFQHFHSHFSEIEYTDKGERRHLPLNTNREPDYTIFLEVLKERGYDGVVICETPRLDLDAIILKEAYDSV